MHRATAIRLPARILVAVLCTLGWSTTACARDPSILISVLLALPLILLGLAIWLWRALRARPRLRAIVFALIAAFTLTPVPGTGGGGTIALLVWVISPWSDAHQVVNALTACALAAAMLLSVIISAWPHKTIRDAELDSSHSRSESESGT